MEFIIHPYEGVEIPGKGMIKFGMSREEVRSFFEEEPEEFFKNTKSTLPVDAFEQSYIHVFYNESRKLEAIEFDFRAKLFFKGENLFSLRTIKCFKDFFNKFDEHTTSYDSGFDSLQYGISVYSPDPDHDPVEGVMVFRQGYLEK